METIQKRNKATNPRKGANLLSVITFAYIFPTFIKGSRRELEEHDIPQHLEHHASKKLGNELEESWRKEQMLHRNPSLWRAIARVFGWEFMLLGLMLTFLEIVLKIIQTLALAQLISYYTQTDNDISENGAYLYAGLIVGASFLNVLMGHHYMMGIQNFGMKLRVALCSLIYRKSLRLSKSVLGGTTVGQMVNLLSNDVNRCDRCVLQAHNLWICPIETVIVVGILYGLVGFTATTGVLFMALFLPLQMFMGKKTSEFRLQTALKTDERIRLMNEIINGIQFIKMCTWEKPFSKVMAVLRRLEISNIQRAAYIKGLTIAFTGFTTRTAIFLTILTCVLVGDAIKAEYVFIVTSFYNILRQAMTVHFPGGITDVAEIRISISRCLIFLLHKETDAGKEKRKYFDSAYSRPKEKKGDEDQLIEKCKEPNTTTNADIGILLRDASAQWASDPSETLSDINFHIQPNQTVAIVGPVGSGKTSLLHVILKELPLKTGSFQLGGAISYAPQEPWVFSGTVRQNILFGQPMDSKRYQEVVRVCALERDFRIFPYGDQTLVGERGVTLSGGQKARISLARAIYRDADIYILDDPLSAVDTHVGKLIFEECISKFLRYKSTVLVTHQLQYLQGVDFIYLIEDGRITIKGTHLQLMESGIKYTRQFYEDKRDVPTKEDDETKEDTIINTKVIKNEAPTEIKEQRSSGHVSSNVYAAYFRSGGSCLVAVGILSIFILTQLSASASDYFLTYWVNLEQAKEQNTTQMYEDSWSVSTNACIYIYSGIIVVMVAVTLLRSFSSLKYAMKASTKLHDEMLSNVINAPMRFFNTNSSGRILNRFSKDTGAVDEVLPMIFIDCLQIGLTVFAVSILVAIVNPWLLIETAVIFIVFYYIRILFLSTSRSVKRLEGITRSPVFGHLSISLHGLTTIRAFEAQGILQREFDNHQDLHTATWHLYLICTRAFGFWLDLICCVYIATVTFSFLFMKNEQYGGNVGLAVTQAISLTGLFQWGMRQWGELENQMTSVERIVEYINIEPETNSMETISSVNRLEKGSIEFRSVSLRYSPSDRYVLKNLNFSIKSREKIGIVGRTGAGKSSLIYALFQLTETEGIILIDDMNIAKMPLYSSRSNISIITQEPVLFSGTLRKNLDPFDEHSDEELWHVLEEVELKDVVAALPSGLQDQMSEGGSNFSVGQRQLFCLARAIARKNKILILDEATANVDPQTDALIQGAIRRKFADCTVLTIAHRLNTIMDSDKILVLDAGALVEFDHPYVLLKNENSMFYSMVQQVGQAMIDSSMKIARDSYELASR